MKDVSQELLEASELNRNAPGSSIPVFKGDWNAVLEHPFSGFMNCENLGHHATCVKIGVLEVFEIVVGPENGLGGDSWIAVTRILGLEAEETGLKHFAKADADSIQYSIIGNLVVQEAKDAQRVENILMGVQIVLCKVHWNMVCKKLHRQRDADRDPYVRITLKKCSPLLAELLISGFLKDGFHVLDLALNMHRSYSPRVRQQYTQLFDM
jgi:hypothetical protein